MNVQGQDGVEQANSTASIFYATTITAQTNAVSISGITHDGCIACLQRASSIIIYTPAGSIGLISADGAVY